jgi:hypothetical protein
MSSCKSLDSELDRHDGGILDIVTMLGASCLKTRREDPMFPSSGVHGCPRPFSKCAMHAMAGESKTTSSRGRPSSAIFSSDGVSTRRVLLEKLFFEHIHRWSRHGFVV